MCVCLSCVYSIPTVHSATQPHHYSGFWIKSLVPGPSFTPQPAGMIINFPHVLGLIITQTLSRTRSLNRIYSFNIACEIHEIKLSKEVRPWHRSRICLNIPINLTQVPISASTQAYPCVGTPNQKWSIKAASSAGGTFIVSSTDTCMTACQAIIAWWWWRKVGHGGAFAIIVCEEYLLFCQTSHFANITLHLVAPNFPQAPPPPANPFCPQYHPIHDRSVYDPR